MNTQTTFYRWKFIFRCPYKAFVSRISLWNTLYIENCQISQLDCQVAFLLIENFVKIILHAFERQCSKTPARNQMVWTLSFLQCSVCELAQILGLNSSFEYASDDRQITAAGGLLCFFFAMSLKPLFSKATTYYD